MHSDYNSSHPNETVFYEYYTKVLEEQNIGFYDAEVYKWKKISSKKDHLNEEALLN